VDMRYLSGILFSILRRRTSSFTLLKGTTPSLKTNLAKSGYTARKPQTTRTPPVKASSINLLVAKFRHVVIEMRHDDGPSMIDNDLLTLWKHRDAPNRRKVLHLRWV